MTIYSENAWEHIFSSFFCSSGENAGMQKMSGKILKWCSVVTIDNIQCASNTVLITREKLKIEKETEKKHSWSISSFFFLPRSRRTTSLSNNGDACRTRASIQSPSIFVASQKKHTHTHNTYDRINLNFNSHQMCCVNRFFFFFSFFFFLSFIYLFLSLFLPYLIIRPISVSKRL